MHNINSAHATPAANPGTTLSTKEFLDAILPDEGLRCVAMTNGTGMAQTFHENNAEAAAEISAQDAKGLTVYFGCATYQTDSNRKAVNVQAVKAFWADIDCGDGKPYAGQTAGVLALRAMLKATGLPAPIVVGSGRGLHIYWPLSNGISPAEWQETARLLKETLAAAGLEADPSRTADVASILRPPGTTHRKDPSNHLPVGVLHRAAPCKHSAFRGRLVSYLAQAGIDPDDALLPGGAPAAGLNDDLRGGMDALRGSWFDALAPEGKSACLEEMLAVPGVVAVADQERGEWLPIVMACAQSGAPDAENLCRQWSQSSKRYEAAAFAKDWRSACQDTRSVTVGTLIKAAQDSGWDATRWRGAPGVADGAAGPVSGAVAPSGSLDMRCFSVAPMGVQVAPRRWVLGKQLIRQQYTMLAAPGGRGKSALAMAMALSVATGRDLLSLGEVKRANVLLVNAEDSPDELQRRMQAASIHYKISDADVAGRLFAVGAGRMPGLTLNRVNPATRQGEVHAEGFALLECMILGCDAGIVILDPLVAMCPAGLNDNAVAAAVMRKITELAVRLNVAVLIVHHVRKGTLGHEASQEDASGAAALVNLARVGLGIERLDAADALKVGVMPGDAWRYLTLANTKANLAPLQERRWFQLETVTLPNADPAGGYPYGDDVQVVAPFTPQVAGSLLNAPMLRAVMMRLAQGCKGGTEPFCPSIKAKGETNFKAEVGRALGVFFPNEAPAGLERLAAQAVTELTAQGLVSEVSVSRAGRNKGKGMLVKWAQSPWAEEPEPGQFVG